MIRKLLHLIDRWFARRGHWVQVHSLPASSPTDTAYVGDLATAWDLAKRGIECPEKREPGHCAASIGFSPQKQQWYGWSHRGIAGFGVGSKVNAGDCAASGIAVGFVAETLEDAKRIASAFAEDIS